MKCKAFSLLELIIVIFLGSILVIYSFSYSKELYEIQITNENTEKLKIDLNSTRIIIEKNLPHSKDLLRYENKKLYYDGYLLLDEVNNFQMKILSNNILVIFIELENKIKQEWKFKL